MCVASLVPLQFLTALRSLVCSHSRVSDLSPLRALKALHNLICCCTWVSDLSPLAALTALRSLDCNAQEPGLQRHARLRPGPPGGLDVPPLPHAVQDRGIELEPLEELSMLQSLPGRQHYLICALVSQTTAHIWTDSAHQPQDADAQPGHNSAPT